MVSNCRRALRSVTEADGPDQGEEYEEIIYEVAVPTERRVSAQIVTFII
jgi:hypothetical protein